MGGLLPSLEAGLFPLPNVVLLPGATLPLQIFEPRYRTMVREALEDQSLIAMALLRPGYEAYYYTNLAAIHPVVCLGRIREHIRIADGRYFVNLVGICRARVRGEDREGEYRKATLDPMPEPTACFEADGEYAARQSLGEILDSPAFCLMEGVREYRKMLKGSKPLGEVVDLAAGGLLPSEAVEIRQRILEQTDAVQRARTLLTELRTLGKTLEAQQSGLRQWPRLGSPN